MLKGPLASLTDAAGRPFGRHYDGPTWEAVDGSTVVRDPSTTVRSTPAPDATADVPWLLVKVAPGAGPAGTLTPAGYVQRLGTAGGQPPARPPVRLGTLVGVPYTATYRFFTTGGD